MTSASHRFAIVICALSSGLIGTAALSPAQAASMKPATSLAQVAAQGASLFNHDKFGGVRTCSSCHVNGGTTMGQLPNGAKIPSLMGVAAQFPRYNAANHQVVTLEQQLAHCITGGLQGKAPSAYSPEMTALVTYLTKLSKGAIMGQQFK